ncbi:hypothetical protein AG0111_0g468 [Alternaria gaisen]|uniref:Uncharacterized protein n=1 Tax=Alternaria gaisen TaxID=167740 RepID=A0ACB6G3L9_9PLEO|nr:hypothetical protein AG0111_0g468 [Alternaria gaisen]
MAERLLESSTFSFTGQVDNPTFKYYWHDGKRVPGNIYDKNSSLEIRWVFPWEHTAKNETDQRKAVRTLEKWLFLEKKPELFPTWPFSEVDETNIDKLIKRIQKEVEGKEDFDTKEVTFSAKALEMTMMETPPFFEGEKIDELLKKPTYLVMKHDRRRTLWQYYKNDANHEDTRKMLDIIQTAPYLHLLVTTSTDLRALVRTAYDAKEWLAFLATTHIPVFPWEHSTYVRIRQALNSCGIRPKGSLAGLIKTKKRSDSFAREKDMSFCPLPFDDFYIDNIDLASRRFHIMPILHPRTVDGFDDKVVSAYRILEQVRAQPKVDTEELIKDVIHAKATIGRRDHMSQALIASNRRAFEMGWAGALKHLGLLDLNKRVNYFHLVCTGRLQHHPHNYYQPVITSLLYSSTCDAYLATS